MNKEVYVTFKDIDWVAEGEFDPPHDFIVQAIYLESDPEATDLYDFLDPKIVDEIIDRAHEAVVEGGEE